MRIPIDRQSSTPLYRQIQDYLLGQIQSGRLTAETRLPSSREMAASLAVSRLTVSEAYDELEAQGYLYSVRGRGTFVSLLPEGKSLPQCDETCAARPYWQDELRSGGWSSASLQLDQLIDGAMQPGIISFALAGGDRGLFPFNDFRQALQTAMRCGGPETLGYGDPAGYAPLRATIGQILAGQGVPADPRHILITSGAQQSLDLVFRLLLRPGDHVLSESPTHMGFSDLCRSLNVHQVEIPVDDQGMDIECAAEAIRQFHPRLIYTIPNFHNPTGACMSSIRRRRLAALAEEYQIPILEDDYVGDLRYRGPAQPALKALDRQGTVMYVGTFSKMLIPSLRIGYVVSNDVLFTHLLDLKHTSDTTSSNLIQHALDEYITVGRYQACLRRARRVFGRRREAMLAALGKYMPRGTQWSNPSGGMLIWVRLPENWPDADELFGAAARAGVLYAPGSYFFPNREPGPFLRLNFASQSIEAIDEGIRRLGTVFRV